MLEFGYAALKLAGPLTRITTSLIGRDSAQRERVASDLERIAGCCREIANRLQSESEPDIRELTGRLDYYTGMICRTLNAMVSKQDAPPNQMPLLTNADVTSFAKRLLDLANDLKCISTTRKDKRHKRLVNELKEVAGYLTAQAEEIRSRKGGSNKTWQNLRPAMMKIGTGFATSWAAVEAVSAVSFEHIEENYGLARQAFRKLLHLKDESSSADGVDASIAEDDDDVEGNSLT